MQWKNTSCCFYRKAYQTKLLVQLIYTDYLDVSHYGPSNNITSFDSQRYKKKLETKMAHIWPTHYSGESPRFFLIVYIIYLVNICVNWFKVKIVLLSSTVADISQFEVILLLFPCIVTYTMGNFKIPANF